MRIAVAVSGGVDSLCALLRLSREGHEVLALHGIFLPDATADGPTPDGLRAACRKLGLEFHIADLRDRFRQDVMEPFAAAYARGKRPIPVRSAIRASNSARFRTPPPHWGQICLPPGITPASLPRRNTTPTGPPPCPPLRDGRP